MHGRLEQRFDSQNTHTKFTVIILLIHIVCPFFTISITLVHSLDLLDSIQSHSCCCTCKNTASELLPNSFYLWIAVAFSQ